jgi:23S rRNA (guanosine2251-2'-O)-methyltransferase
MVEKDVGPRPGPRPPAEGADVIFGRHAVFEALKAAQGRSVNKLWLLRGGSGGPFESIVRLAREKNIVFQWVDRRRLDQLANTPHHQGVVARASDLVYAVLEDVLPRATSLVLLDGIEDTGNLGAIVRNAAFFGVSAVVVPRWRSAGLGGAAFKASAGTLAQVPLVQVSNVAQTILDLKQRNFWVYGADMGGQPCDGFSPARPWALVIGAEDTGLHRLVRERCDALVQVPGSGAVESLNASSAAAVLLYEFSRKKTK